MPNAVLTRYAIQTPRLLILLLLSRCNNRCRFCMVDEDIQTREDMPLGIGRQLIRTQPPSGKIEFFGGEPTVYPHFWELLSLARERGHQCSIATNGRAFASGRYTARMASLGAAEIYVRTSLYGPDAATHDYYTRTPHSFDQTVRGIQNLVSLGFTCQVNVVMLRRNAESLSHLVRLVAGWGVPRIKFGMLVDCEKSQDHLTPLSELRGFLNSAVHLALQFGLRVTIEKAPMCIAPDYLSHFSCERQLVSVDRAYAIEGACGKCVMARWCAGLDPFYLKHFGSGELEPIRRIPANQVHQPNQNALKTFQPEIFKIHLFALNPTWLGNRKALRELMRLEQRITENLGEMALIPPELIERE